MAYEGDSSSLARFRITGWGFISFRDIDFGRSAKYLVRSLSPKNEGLLMKVAPIFMTLFIPPVPLLGQKLLDLFGKGGDYLLVVAHHAIGGFFEDVCFRVFVYGDNVLGATTTGQVLAGT